MPNMHNPMLKFKPCYTNNIHPEQMWVRGGGFVCQLAVGEMREQERATGIVYLF